ncbi:MAG: hypothetical protein AAGB26_03990 [Planctomycetota bacterium]
MTDSLDTHQVPETEKPLLYQQEGTPRGRVFQSNPANAEEPSALEKQALESTAEALISPIW